MTEGRANQTKLEAAEAEVARLNTVLDQLEWRVQLLHADAFAYKTIADDLRARSERAITWLVSVKLADWDTPRNIMLDRARLALEALRA